MASGDYSVTAKAQLRLAEEAADGLDMLDWEDGTPLDAKSVGAYHRFWASIIVRLGYALVNALLAIAASIREQGE